MTNCLYIIGNGFDIHHGLRTSYSDFCTYLKINNPEFYQYIDKYIDFDNSNTLWEDFENDLSKLKMDEILSDNSIYLPNILDETFKMGEFNNFPDALRQEKDSIVIGLRKNFESFLKSVKIPLSVMQRIVKINKDSYFLTFNYTDTLERLYSIDSRQILYIHNSIKDGNIVFGHGISPEKFKEKALLPPNNLNALEKNEWFQKNDTWDYSFDVGKENLLEYFFETYKHTSELIKNNLSFFQNLNNIKCVFVLGHSLSDNDLPYFKEIIKNTPSSIKWVLSFYSNKDYLNILNKLPNLGLKFENIELIKIEEIQIANRQLKFDF